MKARILLIVFLVALVLLPALICAGVCLADDGNSGPGGFWEANKGWIIPILTFIWAMYSPAVYKEWVNIWNDKKSSTWLKVGWSIAALVKCAGPVLSATLKQYGGSILAIVKTLIRVKLGIPVAARRLSGRPRRL